MMSIGAALAAAATRIGHAPPPGSTGEHAPAARAARADETEDASEMPDGEAALLVAVEAGLREAGYLAN